MAKITLNSALHGISGRIDNWVYRKLGDRMVIGRRPEFNGPPSVGQIAVRERFRSAAAYARAILANPAQKILYEVAARAKGVPVFAFTMGDFLKPPVIQSINASAYRGSPGDLIKVNATDDFEVVSVNVIIRNSADIVIEEGPAALLGGFWTYTTGQVVIAGETVSIEAVAKDHPGNSGNKVMAWLIT